MDLQHNVQPRSSTNGFGRRRVDREIVVRTESKMQTGKSASSSSGNTANGAKSGAVSPSRDRLIYVISYLLGLHVEVHVRNGSIISGIFHATNAEKDFAIVLKMAQVVKDGSTGGKKSTPQTAKKPMDMIIQAKDLVQVIAKDVPLNIEEFSNANPREKRKDLMIDSAISHSHHLEVERELERWTPDENDPECPDLENIFDGKWNRGWDQFETNEALFGVRSTFDEELYTTKLYRGPKMREIEREATRIAREIEGEDTRDIHLAEERGIQFDEDFDHDEELKYSAVQRDIDGNSFRQSQSSSLDAYNSDTFGSSRGSALPKSYSNASRSKFIDEAHVSPTCSSVDADSSAQIHSDEEANCFGVSDLTVSSADIGANKPTSAEDKRRVGEKQIKNQDKEKNWNDCSDMDVSEKVQTSEDKGGASSTEVKGLTSTVAYDTLSASSQDSKQSAAEPSKAVSSASTEKMKRPQHSGTATSNPEQAGSASSSAGLSPSSSMGSVASEKSKLNPNAKEFKLNPNAKSFTPSSSFRPPTQMSEGSYYYAGNLPAVPPMHSVPMGISIGPSFVAHQQVYNSQSAPLPSPQTYIHPNAPPLYGQQVILGQPRPVYYMPTYPPEMQYKGRNF